MTGTRREARDRQTWETDSVDATFALGQALGESLSGGLVIGLVGPLGSGKTVLVKGTAAGNSIDDVRRVTSPTFTLVHEYPGRLRLFHVDVYRLGGADELFALGFDEWMLPEAAVIVEWADRVRSLIPKEALWIELEPTGENSRTVRFEALGDCACRCLECIRAAYR